jgi:hypothetical protein
MKTIFLSLFLLLFAGFLSAQDAKYDCRDYRQGFFRYADEDFSNTLVYRKRGYQVEFNKKKQQYVTISIEWVDDCQYNFEYLSSDMPELARLIGTTAAVEIVSGDERGYDFRATFNRDNIVYAGRLVVEEEYLSKEERKRMKKLWRKTRK